MNLMKIKAMSFTKISKSSLNLKSFEKFANTAIKKYVDGLNSY